MRKSVAIILVATLLSLAASMQSKSGPPTLLRIPKHCSQIILVVSGSWESSTGTLRAFEKDDKNGWKMVGRSSDVQLGRRGMGWGVSTLIGPQKREGDNKAPAGMFPLSSAFGYATKPPETRLRYVPITATTVCVDDPRSHYYNRMLDASTIKSPDWRSAENMKLRDIRYKWGVVVMHNSPRRSGEGSCIFLHVWKDAKTSTTGCTAMPEPVMLALIKWLDPAKQPVLVQMPRDVYREKAEGSDLPQI